MKFRAMTATAVVALMMALPGFANDASASTLSGPRYVPRADIPLSRYTAEDESDDRSDRRTYNAYEHREQCQRYRRIPRNSVELSDCSVVRADPAPARPVAAAVRTTTTETRTTLLPIVHTETIYFGFDRSNIRADQMATLQKIVSEIDTYKPADITVTGYTDRSGKVSYNEKLSGRRAYAVSEALKKRGVENKQIDQESRGETENAVPTADGVKMPENRRVVVDFRR